MLYFFLSYARGDNDGFVERFFRDLSAEVRDLAGQARHEEVGFLDVHSIELGARWPTKLVNALAECRLFIALLSPRYFISEACGKEWAAFEQRLKAYEQSTGDQLPLLVPLIWLPTQTMPEIAFHRQFSNDTLDEAYDRHGLRQLMRLQRNHDAYVDAVSTVARHIVEYCEAGLPAARQRPDFGQLRSAFQTVATSTKTSQYVHFVVAAPTVGELSAHRVRQDMSYYGETSSEWAPFRPNSPAPIASYAMDIAAEQSFRSETVTLDRLMDRLDFAYRHNQIVVLLLDAWETRIVEHRQVLEACDIWSPASEDPGVPTVLIPVNHGDGETGRHWRDLSRDLRSVFANRYADGDDRLFRPSVLSFPAFEADLKVALGIAQNHTYVRGTPLQDLPDAGPARPRLGLPDLPS
ncbi:TIR-like protein FxsC [Hamadaea tsunoensis]|uniref:TIR-like protein FxsC n=1 Tax=Hamadaea tsunoensis TaxID=53368 RepID=UPI00146FC4F9|nr:TIR-like protein FxsC [Hamadaea tsunoensis]